MSTALAEVGKVEAVTVTLGAPMKNENNVRALLGQYQKAFERVAPRHLDVNRMLRVALMTVSRSSYLLECTAQSLLGAFMLATQMGLDIAAREAHLVPFYNSKTKLKELQLVPDYRGIIKLIRNSRQVSNVRARLVYRNDIFELEEGLTPKLRHIPNFELERKDDDILGAYSVADFCDFDGRPTGYADAHFVPISYLKRVRSKSPSGDKGPWVEHFGEMCLKTVIKHHAKTLPYSVELATALAIDSRAEMMKPQQIALSSPVAELMSAEVPLDDEPETEAEKADKTDKTDKTPKGKSKLDQVVAAAKAKTEAPEPPKIEDDGTLCTDDDWNDLGTIAYDAHIEMRAVREHITGTMGFAASKDLTKARMPEVEAWIKAKSK